MDPSTNEPLSETNDLLLETGDPAVSSTEASHLDPVTGEPGAHPAAVGVGAFSAGAAGAAIGALAGPVGMLIGAAIGAVAGGLAGHEVAVSNDERQDAATTSDLNPEGTGSTTDMEGRPSSVAATPVPVGGSPHLMPGYDLGLPVATMHPKSPLEPDGSDTVTDGTFDAAATAARSAGEYREFAAGNALSSPSAGSEPAGPVSGGESKGGSSAFSEPAGTALAGTFAGSLAEDEPASASLFGKPSGPSLLDEPMQSPSNGDVAPVETVRMSAYYRYLDRIETGRSGDTMGDWLEAEQETTTF